MKKPGFLSALAAGVFIVQTYGFIEGVDSAVGASQKVLHYGADYEAEVGRDMGAKNILRQYGTGFGAAGYLAAVKIMNPK